MCFQEVRMQVIFTIDEFRTLVHVLREHEHEAEPGRDQAISRILRKVLERDFGFAADELQVLEDLLAKASKRLKGAPIPPTEPERETFLRQRRLTEQILDKVVEACAMF
jgi:tRNA C32,U32 (ribose-2'-O)-methylase TrmJ